MYIGWTQIFLILFVGFFLFNGNINTKNLLKIRNKFFTLFPQYLSTISKPTISKHTKSTGDNPGRRNISKHTKSTDGNIGRRNIRKQKVVGRSKLKNKW